MAIDPISIVAGGIGLIGKLLGGGKQKTENSVDYRKMVREAEAAGFNPLTALRNGGAAGFSNSITHAPLGAGDVLSAAGDFFANFDPLNDDKRELEADLVKAQIENLNADTSARKIGFAGVPTYTAKAEKRELFASSPSGRSSPPLSEVVQKRQKDDLAFEKRRGVATSPEYQATKNTSPYAWLGWESHPDRANVEDAETSTGDNEINSTINSVIAHGLDAKWNFDRVVMPKIKSYASSASDNFEADMKAAEKRTAERAKAKEKWLADKKKVREELKKKRPEYFGYAQ